VQFSYVKLLPNCDKYVIIICNISNFSKRGDKMRRMIIALIMISVLVTSSFASPALPNANAFLASADRLELVDKMDSSEVGQALSGILLLVYKVGYGAAVVVLLYIAIQMIIAPAQKKAEVKAALTPYLIGLLLLVAGVPIATMIIKMFTTIF